MFLENNFIQANYKNGVNNIVWSSYRLTTSDQDHIVDENDFIGFLFKSDSPINDDLYKINLGEFEFDLIHLGEINGTYYYTTSFDDIYPEESNFWHNISSTFPVKLAKILLNNIGILNISLLDTNNGTITKLGSVEVTSNKLDNHDINDLFDYLLGKEVSYWNPFALTFQQNENKPLRVSFFVLVAQLEADINNIATLLPDFIENPISSLNSTYVNKIFDEREIMDDDSIQWLFSNLDVLEKTNIISENTVRIKNNIFNISKMLTKDFYDNKDIYENQIIVGFFLDLFEVLNNHVVNINLKLDTLAEEDVFLNKHYLIRIQERKFLERQSKTIKELINVVTSIDQTFSENFHINFPLPEAPNSTNKFESKEHYLTIQNIIIRWYDNKDLSWGTNELFGGIRTLDKLYELFCLYKMFDLLKEIGFKDPKSILDSSTNYLMESYHVGMYDFGKSVDSSCSVKMFYEKLPDALCTIIPTSNGKDLRPDFILEITTKNDVKYIILDAKFKKVKNIKKFTFKELIPKYLHGIGRVDGLNANIVGLILLYPEDRDLNNKWKIDFHKRIYSSDGEKTVFPIISAVEVPLNKQRSMNLKDLISKLRL